MEREFSFRFIKLGIALTFLLISAILPGTAQYLPMVLGGIALMTAFASFGNYDYRGIPSNLTFKIVRYALTLIILAIASIQIYIQIEMPHSVHYSPYSTIVDIALIAYILNYKPSGSSAKKKAIKGISYGAILIGINSLQYIQSADVTRNSFQIDWSAVLASILIVAIGLTLLIIGSKKNQKAKTV